MDPESAEQAEQALRRSARANKGKQPQRYGASETTSVVGSTVSSTSALRRKRLEAELALQRRQAELTAQIVEQQRALATAEHELRQAELDEEEEEILLRSGDEAYSHEDLHTESRSSRTAQWVNDVSPKNPPQPISVSRQPAAETATMTTADNAPAPGQRVRTGRRRRTRRQLICTRSARGGSQYPRRRQFTGRDNGEYHAP